MELVEDLSVEGVQDGRTVYGDGRDVVGDGVEQSFVGMACLVCLVRKDTRGKGFWVEYGWDKGSSPSFSRTNKGKIV